MLLYYIRHGDPIYNPDSLTPLGHRQADAVAKRLAVYGIDRIFASTSNRAILTATPTSELTKKPIEQLDFCNEGHAWHDFAIKPEGHEHHFWAFAIPQIRRLFLSPEVAALGERWYEHPALSGYRFKEGVERINREVDAWMSSLGYDHDRTNGIYLPNESASQKRIALFAHQGFGISFLSSLLDIPYPMFSAHFDLSHSSMTVIDFTPHEGVVIPKALQVSNDSHLWREGLPTYFNNVLPI